jgi:hypothetical protein
VNIVRGIGEIFEFLTDVDDMPEWINLYAPIYHNANIINGVGDMAFEKEYSIFIKRAAREAVAEKSKKSRKCKKKIGFFKYFLSFF